MIWFIKDDDNMFVNVARKSKQTRHKVIDNLLITTIAMLVVIGKKQKIETEHGTLIFTPKDSNDET